jgi:hypothetical protein
MKFQYALLTIALFSGALLMACSKDETEPNRQRFIHIMENDASSVTVNENANTIGTYNIYLSSPQFFDTVTVNYRIVPGSGLAAGKDYELINSGSEVTFLPGIFDMPVRVKWLANSIDTTKNNSLVIELLTNNKGITMGLPGPDKRQTTFTITKIR